MENRATTPVLIVGAGLAGLSTAMFLGVHGVRALVVERHPGLSAQPKARGQVPPTMEALASAGVADRFLAANPPGRPAMKIVAAESVTGKILFSVSEAIPDMSALSPARDGLVSQQRAEAILAARALELGAEIRFHTRLESLEQQDGDAVTAVLADLESGGTTRVDARYLVVADGHRGPLRNLLGIGVHGRRGSDGTTTTFFAQFDADLALALDGCAFGLWHLQNPRLPGGGAVIVTADEPGRYVFGGGLAPEDARPHRLVEHIRAAAGIPDLRVTILETAWSTGDGYLTRVADRFREGRTLLVGDAAHLMPPTGGQGGNTAVMDGYHLAWKLAWVLGGRAPEGLLQSHDTERRPYADLLVEQQYAYLVQRADPSLRDGTEAEIIAPERGLFGYVLPAGAFVAEPGAGQPFEDPAHPSGRPGSRAPHVPLADGSSTRDLFGRRFVLLTADRGGAWASPAARLDVDLHVLQDDGGRFRSAYGLGEGGAALIRPDGIIAWRSANPAGLASALETVLGGG